MKTTTLAFLLALLLVGCVDSSPQERTAPDGHKIVFRSPRGGPPSHPMPAREMHLTDESELLPANHKP